MNYPTAWRNTNPSEVGGRTFGSQERRDQEQYTDAYLAAAFADWNGATFNGCYLNYVWVEVMDDGYYEQSALQDIEASMEDWVSSVVSDYPEADARVLEQMHEVRIAGVPACKQVWSFFYGGYTMVVTECALIADDSVYFLALTTTEDDRDANAPLFKQIIENFVVTGSSDQI
jgi:hypothetical protein